MQSPWKFLCCLWTLISFRRYVRLLETRVASLEKTLKTTDPSFASDHLDNTALISCNVAENDDAGDSGDAGDTASQGCSVGDNQQPEIPGYVFPEISFASSSSHANDYESSYLVEPFAPMSPGVQQILNLDLFEESGVDCTIIEDESIPPQKSDADERRISTQWEQIPFVLDSHSTSLARATTSLFLAKKYANEYFSSAHPMWPFLHDSQWENCWGYWTAKAREGLETSWRGVLVDMVREMPAIRPINWY